MDAVQQYWVLEAFPKEGEDTSADPTLHDELVRLKRIPWPQKLAGMFVPARLLDCTDSLPTDLSSEALAKEAALRRRLRTVQACNAAHVFSNPDLTMARLERRFEAAFKFARAQNRLQTGAPMGLQKLASQSMERLQWWHFVNAPLPGEAFGDCCRAQQH